MSEREILFDPGTFLRQYDFLSQIVNYEDPSLEKLSI
jgi:type I restriction enzyme, R subunit